MKALVPAAGLGTRCLPLTKAVPKELFPVDGLPVLHHVVAEAKAAGCSEIGIILSPGKEAIQRYFTWDAELMNWLDAVGKRAVMTEWEHLMDGLTFTWLEQPVQRGLGDAVSCGAEFANGEPVCLLLGDTVMEHASPLPTMVERYAATHRSQVAVEALASAEATRYGVCGGRLDAYGYLNIDSMIEKPALDEMPSVRQADGAATDAVFAFAARYVFSPTVWSALRSLPPGRHGEIQLTDAMAAVLAAEGFGGVPLPGVRRDIGLPTPSQTTASI